MRYLLRHRADHRALRAFAERQELVKAGLTRRDLVKMGLMTTGGVGGGLVLADKSLADNGGLGSPPPLTPFVEPLPVLPALPPRVKSDLTPAPANPPNRATNPATGLPFEGRTEVHQSEDRFPPQAFFQTRMGANPNAKVHPDLPAQTVWGFNQGGADLTADPPISPGPVLVLRYGAPTIVRRHNALPPPGQNGGFGVPEVSTHLHNFHSAPDSDGGPCDPVQQRFFSRGQYYDYFYNMQFAGWNSTNPPHGNIQEALGFLWYHDHRVDHTSENTYKGLVGPAIAFNDFDTGDEHTGLPPAELPGLRHPARLRGQTVRSAHRPAGVRHVQHRRHPRQRVPGERQGPAVLRGVQAPLPLPDPRRRPVAVLRVLPHEPRQPEPEDPVLGHLQRRQPAPAAGPGHEPPPRCGRARRHHRRLREDRQRDADPPREPTRAGRRPRADGQHPPGGSRATSSSSSASPAAP